MTNSNKEERWFLQLRRIRQGDPRERVLDYLSVCKGRGAALSHIVLGTALSAPRVAEVLEHLETMRLVKCFGHTWLDIGTNDRLVERTTTYYRRAWLSTEKENRP